MHRSILLRLLPAARAGDRLAGVAEEVETGERTAFRDAADLVTLLHRLQAGATADGVPPHDAPATGEPSPQPR